MTLQIYLKNLQKQFHLDKKEIEIVICYALKINTAALFIHDLPLKASQEKKINSMLTKRQQGIPFAYLTGTKDFWTLRLKVNKHTLIPRPETELIIEYVLSKTTAEFNGAILDLGTGTGAIALSLAQERPHAKVVAVDKCIECVKIAISNKKTYQLNNTKVLQSNWFDELTGQTFDFIISNPPYIASHDKHLEKLQHEPYSALVANDNGYSDLNHIIKYASKYMNKNAELILEHGYNQVAVIQDKLTSNCYQKVKSHKDLAGIERITTADTPKSCY